MKLKTTAALAATLILTIGLAACGALDYLQLAINAGEIALPLLPIGDPATKAAAESYLASTSQFVTQAIDIEAGPGTAAQKAAEIAAAAATLAKPNIPAQYQGLADALSKVAAYVASYLAGLPRQAAASGTAAATLATPQMSARRQQLRTRAAALHAKTSH